MHRYQQRHHNEINVQCKKYRKNENYDRILILSIKKNLCCLYLSITITITIFHFSNNRSFPLFESINLNFKIKYILSRYFKSIFT